jgi:hypothetical protein
MLIDHDVFSAAPDRFRRVQEETTVLGVSCPDAQGQY